MLIKIDLTLNLETGLTACPVCFAPVWIPGQSVE